MFLFFCQDLTSEKFFIIKKFSFLTEKLIVLYDAIPEVTDFLLFRNTFWLSQALQAACFRTQTAALSVDGGSMGNVVLVSV